jgi:hypothetical protein
MFNGPVFNNETIQANARAVNAGGISENLDEANALYSRLSGASFKLVPSSFKGGTLYSGTPGVNGDLTWTRASDAFRTNASGLIQRVPWNLLTNSNELSSQTLQGNYTVNSNVAISPDGTQNADKFIVTITGTFNGVLKQPIPNGTYAVSMFAKASGKNWIFFYEIGHPSGANGVWFDISTGQIGAIGAAWSNVTIENVGNEWFRCSANTTLSGTNYIYYLTADSNLSTTTTANGTDGVLMWGLQYALGTTAQTYLPTTDRLNFPRLSYMYGSCPSVLLEPQRTNVVLWSSDLSQSVWSKTNYALSNVTAIQGLTATRITKNATSNGAWNNTNGRNVINTVGTFASGVKTFSVLLRKGNTAKVGLLINGILVGASTVVGCEFDFSTETFTNVSSGLTATFEKPTTDVYRLILVCNETGTGTSKNIWIAPIDSSNNTVTDGYVDIAYFQWEAGAYPTTYIPTTSATATRVADSFSRNNIYTNGLISASGGTWFVELRGNVAYTRDATTRLGIGDTTALTTNSIQFGVSSGGSFRLQIVTFVSGSGATIYTTTTDTTKIAIKWNGTTADVFANGTKVVSATSFTATNMENLISSIGVPFFIQQMALYPSALSDTDCISLTADYTDGTSIVGDYERYVSQKSGAVENLNGVTNLIQNLK